MWKHERSLEPRSIASFIYPATPGPSCSVLLQLLYVEQRENPEPRKVVVGGQLAPGSPEAIARRPAGGKEGGSILREYGWVVSWRDRNHGAFRMHTGPILMSRGLSGRGVGPSGIIDRINLITH